MNPVDERAAYRGLLTGDQASFDRFFEEFFPRLYHFILMRVGGDHDAARELCQQTLIDALAHFARYRGETTLFVWLCQMARHHIEAWHGRPRGAVTQRARVTEDALLRIAESGREP